MKKVFSLFVIMLSIMLFDNKVLAYEIYEVGDVVTYNGEDYYVISASDSITDYVTLLKTRPLTLEELSEYEADDIYENADGTGRMAYYTSETCVDSNNKSGCKNEYDLSNVKKVVDNWSKSFNNDLEEVNGYKSRLITFEELVDNFGYIGNNYSTYKTSISSKYSWVNAYNYWTMSGFEDSDEEVWGIWNTGWLSAISVIGGDNSSSYINFLSVRPVINLKKCVLDDSCLECENGYNYKTEKITRYKEYQVGDEIEYKGEKYYVIEKRNGNKNYLTLLKAEPLTFDQINRYNNIQYESEDGTIPYYTSDTCQVSSTTGCTTDYDQSIVKTVVDNWVNNELNSDDLVEVYGYKARLITSDELLDNLHYVRHSDTPYDTFISTEETPEWVYSTSSYWTMSSYEDSDILEIYVNNISDNRSVFYALNVRPVIHLNKCILEGGCWEEEIQAENGCVEDSNNSNNILSANDENTIVSVGNTLKVISNVVFVISIILIIGGLGILGYNYIKSKKELKK